MGPILLLVMIVIPIVEIATFLEVGGYLGLWPTIVIVIVTAIIGTTLLRWQGLATFYSAQESLRQNRFPIGEVFDGVCLILAGTLLLTPGFITDAVGLVLFAPPLRIMLRRLIARHIAAYSHSHTQNAPIVPNSNDSTIIDGEYDDMTANHEENNKEVANNPTRFER